MLSSNIQVGLQFAWRDHHWRLEEMLLDHDQLLFRSRQGATSQLSPNEFRKKIAASEVKLLVPGANGVLEPVEIDWKSKEKEKARVHRLRRERLLHIEREAQSGGKTLIEAREDLAGACRKEGWTVPCERTMRAWRNDARQHESCLSPRWFQSGNRRQGPDELFLEAMHSVVAMMLGNDRFTMTKTWKDILTKYEKLCEEKNMPPRNHSPRRLSNYMRTIEWKTIQKSRLDPRTAASLTRTAVCLHTADYFWEMVEMDAAYLPIWIRDEHDEVIKQVIMYAAIDVGTGYIVGFFLTTQNPSVLPFIECLRSMFLPLPDDFDEKYQVVHRLQAFGKPTVLKVDNGPEFVGKAGTEAVRQLHSDVAHCKPYTPQEKPHIERFNGIIKLFVHGLPGSTYSSVTKKSRIPPESEKLFTMEELKGRLYRFIYDEYAFRPNNLRSYKHKKTVTPFHLWQEMSRNVVPGGVVLEVEFNKALYFERNNRVLSSSGIQFDTFNYNSPELAKLWERYGPGRSYDIRSTTLSANIIYVDPGDGGELILAHAKELDEWSMDRLTAKKVRAKFKVDGKELGRMARGELRKQLEELEREAENQTPKMKSQIAEKLKQADMITRKTMPKKQNESPSTIQTASDNWDFEDASLAGRNRGAF